MSSLFDRVRRRFHRPTSDTESVIPIVLVFETDETMATLYLSRLKVADHRPVLWVSSGEEMTTLLYLYPSIDLLILPFSFHPDGHKKGNNLSIVEAIRTNGYNGRILMVGKDKSQGFSTHFTQAEYCPITSLGEVTI